MLAGRVGLGRLAGLRMRSGVLVAVGLGHMGFFLLLADSAVAIRERAAGARDLPQQAPMILVLMDELLGARETSVPSGEGVSPSERVPLEAASWAGSAPAFEIVEPDAAAPSVDWSAETTRAAADAVERQMASDALVARSRSRLSGHPKGMDLPLQPEQREHQNGDTEHYVGETVTWINERCYYTTAPRIGPDAGPLTLALPICKRKTRKTIPPMPGKR